MSRRRVLFDGQVFAEQTHGGVTRYFSSLIQGLAARGKWTPEIHAPFTRSPVPESAIRLRPSFALPRARKGFRLFRTLNRLLTPDLSQRTDGLVYHPTWHHIPTIDRFGRLPTVFTVMDMIPERYPEVSTPDQLQQRAELFERADVLISISNATRDLLVGMFPATSEKVRVIPVPVPERPMARPANRTTLPYFVFVGKRGSYKDFATLVESLALVRPEVTVVYVGGGPLEVQFARRADDLGIADRLIPEPAPDDQRLAELLGSSSGLVSTSLEEGFGLPPFEALATGTRAIVADIPVYRELYGSAAEFFRPQDASSLAEVLEASAGIPAREIPGDVRGHLGWKSADEVYAEFENVYEFALNASR